AEDLVARAHHGVPGAEPDHHVHDGYPARPGRGDRGAQPGQVILVRVPVHDGALDIHHEECVVSHSCCCPFLGTAGGRGPVVECGPVVACGPGVACRPRSAEASAPTSAIAVATPNTV